MKSILYKGLNRSDVYLTDYNSRKWWSVPGTQVGDFNIRIYRGTEVPPFYCSQKEHEHSYYGPVTGTVGETSSYEEGFYNEGAVFGSTRTLYYSGSFLGKYSQILEQDQEKEDTEASGSVSGSEFGYSGFLYPQTTLTITGSRTLPTRSYRDPADTDLPDHQLIYDGVGVAIISIPKDIIGVGITPGTVNIGLDEDVYCYVEDGYVDGICEGDGCTGEPGPSCSYSSGSFCETGYPPGTWSKSGSIWVDPYFEDLHTGPVKDYEGVLLYSGFNGTWDITTEMLYPTPARVIDAVVGDIIYSHGQIVFTNEFLTFLFDRWNAENIDWQSNWPRFTKHFTCKVDDVDYNYTLNPTADIELQMTQGFTPYITSLGLYNDKNELMAVVKFSKPIKKPSDTDMTFDIQIDLG